jgi:hypothetical protein
MNLALSLRCELLKTRRTSIWYFCLITALIAPIYAYLDSSSAYRIEDLKNNPWNMHFLGFGPRILNMMILPVFLMLTCTLMMQVEYRNNTWKQVYVSPQSLLNVFISKYLIIQIQLLGVIILSSLLMIVSLYAVDRGVNLNLSKHSLDWNTCLIFWGRIYVTVLAISALQFWLGLHFKNFIVPIVIGICLLFIAAMMMEENPWVHDDKYPYIYPLRNNFPKNLSERTTVIWGSIAYTALFLVLGFIDFRRRRNMP